MTDTHNVSALNVESVRCEPTGSKLLIKVHGTWPENRARSPRAVLVIEVEGRRLRFPAARSSRRDANGSRSDWVVNFRVPSWLGPSLNGNMSMLIGERQHLVELPPLGSASAAKQESTANGAAQRELPAAAEPADAPGLDKEGPRVADANGRNLTARSAQPGEGPRVRRRPPRGPVRESEAVLRLQLEEARKAAEKERAQRETLQRTNEMLAMQVAKVHVNVIEARASRDRLQEERDRLAAELATVQPQRARASKKNGHSRRSSANGSAAGRALNGVHSD